MGSALRLKAERTSPLGKFCCFSEHRRLLIDVRSFSIDIPSLISSSALIFHINFSSGSTLLPHNINACSHKRLRAASMVADRKSWPFYSLDLLKSLSWLYTLHECFIIYCFVLELILESFVMCGNGVCFPQFPMLSPQILYFLPPILVMFFFVYLSLSERP